VFDSRLGCCKELNADSAAGETFANRTSAHDPDIERVRSRQLASANHQPTIGAIMKILTSADLFSPPKRKRKTKERFARAKLVVAVARDCAVEKAQQRAAPSMTRPPTVLQRRRLAERLGAKS
jgi:hypothetical protein